MTLEQSINDNNYGTLANPLQNLTSKIMELNDAFNPAGAWDPRSNTSLTNQVNLEIKELKEFTDVVNNLATDDINKINLIVKRLARTYISIEWETNEADTRNGSRYLEIRKIQSEDLNEDQKKLFNTTYEKIKEALFFDKYKKVPSSCGLSYSRNFWLHTYQYLRDSWQLNLGANDIFCMNTSRNISLLSLQQETIPFLNSNTNSIESVTLTGWAQKKNPAIADSIRERIKTKLLILTSIALWGVNHEMAHGLNEALGFHSASGASGAPTPHAMGDLGASNIHDVLSSTPAPSDSPSSSGPGGTIASAFASCFSAIGAGLGALCKGGGDCCKGCNCDCCSSSACNDVGQCCSGCGNMSCSCLSDAVNCCLETICSSQGCCGQMLEILSSCMHHLGDCCSGSAKCCGETVNNCCNMNGTDLFLFSTWNCSTPTSCNCSGCCTCSNPFERKTHSDSDTTEGLIRDRYNLGNNIPVADILERTQQNGQEGYYQNYYQI